MSYHVHITLSHLSQPDVEGRWRRVTPLNTSKVTMKFSRPELKIKSKQMNIFNIKKRSVVTDSICSLAETCAANICSGDGQTDQSMDLLS